MRSKPYLIAGPCSAESGQQLLQTAKGLLPAGIDAFRAGLWKPRTHPGGFEGVGNKGLEWLLEVRAQTGIPVGTEVACAEHVEAVLEAGLDMVWIGARTTPNPFLMQEIARSLAGSGIKVWVKNPVSQDIEVWCGAIERLLSFGVENIGLIFRGFSSFEHISGRNVTLWLHAAQMRTRFPQYQMLCDPSHIAGESGMVPALAGRALDLGMDGLMVECHCDPSEALTDASQQMLPQDFVSMVSRLSPRSGDVGEGAMQLELLRSTMDEIDEQILSLLASRMRISRQIGELKQIHSMPIIQPQRWEKVISSVMKSAETLGLDPEFIKDIYNRIHDASVSQQQ